MKFSRFFAWMLTFSTVLMFACGGDSSSSDNSAENDTDATQEDASAPEIPASVELSIEGTDLMTYNTDRLEAYEGQEVTLTLTHVGEMPKVSMGHNWVLLAKDTDPTEFSTAAMTATETDYIPEGMDDAMIAHTSMIGGGENTSVTFTAPAAGVYTFICSFPGHSVKMQGTFVSRGR